jgi:Questin oxidase-like
MYSIHCEQRFCLVTDSHVAHCALALWFLGADGDIINAAYELDCKVQRPAIKSPEAITAQNFTDHLGDDK